MTKAYNIDRTNTADRAAKRNEFAYVSPSYERFEMDDRGLWYEGANMTRPERLSEPFMVRSLEFSSGLQIQFTTAGGITHEFRFNPKDYETGAAITKILGGFGMDMSKKKQTGDWILKYLTVVYTTMWSSSLVGCF
jgi:hypothetical protein